MVINIYITYIVVVVARGEVKRKEIILYMCIADAELLADTRASLYVCVCVYLYIYIYTRKRKNKTPEGRLYARAYVCLCQSVCVCVLNEVKKPIRRCHTANDFEIEIYTQ